MHRCNVSWFIAVVISTKTCVISLEFPKLNFNILNYTLYDAYKDVHSIPYSALNVLHKVNPLNYLVRSDSNYHGNFNSEYTQAQNYAPKVPVPQQNAYPSDFSPNYQVQNSFQLNDYNPQYTTRAVTSSKTTSSHTRRYNLEENAPHNYYSQETTRTAERYVTYYNTNERSTIPTITEMSTPRDIREPWTSENIGSVFNHFMLTLEHLERKFYQATFYKLVTTSSPDRRENGISFTQSALFLYIELMALCIESDVDTVSQIKLSLGLHTTCAVQVQILKHIIQTLPTSSNFLKFRWSSRLVLDPPLSVSGEFRGNTATALHLQIDDLNQADDPSEIAKRLNRMIETDSGGAMQDTFEEDEFSEGLCAAWLTTLYFRARWRAAPTVLNGSRNFYDGTAPPRAVGMIRINDIMSYAHLDEWDAEAIEIQYAHPDLTFLLLLPRERSLKNLARWISSESLQRVYDKMQKKRVAVTLPIYTLRMTLLLPGKLEMMGMSRLLSDPSCRSLKLSHSVQRIMFWAEAGRNAFKDDGIEWDETPELERIVDRPYIFFVRWRNFTLLNGNFVL